MSVSNPLNSKKDTLPQPPARSRPQSTLIVSKTNKKMNAKDRLRSRSANPPNRPSPMPPPGSRKRGIATSKPRDNKNKKLPIPSANKPKKPTRHKASSTKTTPNKTTPNKKTKKTSSRIKTKPKPPPKQTKEALTKPKNPPNAWHRKNNKSNISKKYAKKQLPPSSIKKPPPRKRAVTSDGLDAASPASRPLPPGATVSPEIDERPSLKPSLSSKRSKEKTILLTLNTKKQKKKGVVFNDEDETKTIQHSNRRKPPSKPQPKPKGGHHRDYSFIKSVPSMFKEKSYESPRNRNKHKKQIKSGFFGLNAPKKRNKKGFATKTDKREGVMRGSCQCGAIKYELLSLPQEIQHCYCSMCRKMHGSAVATWSPFLENDIRFIKSAKQTQYKSSDKVTRSFCGVCGSNISLKYRFQTETVWLTPSLFIATKKSINWWLNVRVLHIFCGSKCEWYTIPDDGMPHLNQKDIQNSEVNGEPRFMYSKELPPKPQSD